MSKLFKTKREDFGKSISEVAAITRIKESCLLAIEEEDYDKLPIEVYARGYIKEYAKYLSLPVEDGLSPYEKYLEMKTGPKEKKPLPPTPDQPAEAPQKVREERREGRSDKDSFCQEVKVQTVPAPGIKKEDEKKHANKYLLPGILLLVVVGAIVYQFISSRNAEQESSVAPMNQQMQPPQNVLSNQKDQEVQPPAQPADETNKAETIVPQTKKHELVISANDVSWVQVTMDDSEKKESLMKQGESLTFEANDTMRVIVGNAGGVSLRFDGKELPAGKKGEVLRLTLPENPKVGKQAQEVSSTLQRKPTAPVKPETPSSKKMPDEKVSPNKLPEQQPASTSKP